MPIRSFIGPGAFGPEMIAAGVLEAACKELGDAGRSATVRDTIAGRIIAATKLGERDPARLLEAELRAMARSAPHGAFPDEERIRLRKFRSSNIV
jgi:hypothetical protein